jgi:hypothetical protein
MGCDIHIAFEIKREKGWEPLLPVIIEDMWDFIDEKIADGTAHTLTGTSDDDEALERFKAYLKSMPPEEKLEKFAYHEKVRLSFGCGYDLRGRDYEFFTSIAGVRSYNEDHKIIWQPRGVPDDVSPLVKKEIDYYDCDGHSHSWQMLSELLNEPRIAARHPHKMKPLLEIAKMGDPEKIRMVYYFDN